MRPFTAFTAPLHRTLAPLCAALLLAACASPPQPAPPPVATAPRPAAPPAVPPPPPPQAAASAPVAPASPPAPAVAPQLVAEQRWLEDLFRGTPVAIAPLGPGPNSPLKLEVPLKFSFDDGKAVVKPPLGAVLDRVAASMARQPRTRVQVAAPAAAPADSVRSHLVARGVQAHRIERLPARSDAVELRLRYVAAAGIERLEDPPRPASAPAAARAAAPAPRR